MRRLSVVSATIAAAASCATAKRHASVQPSEFRFAPVSGEEEATCNGVKMNLFQAINSGLDHALSKEKTVLLGEDVEFGGVFRCTLDLRKKHGPQKVIDSPLTEQGIVGFAVGMAAVGWHPIAEVQFADYIFPAFDQIVNEAAKYRFRTGGNFHCGMLIRAPCSAVGHGGIYHSQSVEGYFNHCPGLKIVMPSSPSEAKGLLLKCMEENDPCIFFEPKILYRSAVEEVNPDYYTLPLGKGRVLVEGRDVTIVTYGSQVYMAARAAKMALEEGISVELIDLRSLLPWDRELVAGSVKKTGKVIVTHEAPKTSGYGAELVSSITEDCFLSLEAPPMRVCGLDTPVPLHERLYLPNELKLLDAIKSVVKF
ncbi:hypothetical protein JKF63_01007 [Porcisia hertigi]|uniref:3-methyl-2-oxobutanoate dehydrogenase (2-methylpropanoyl-transferring) n=1 Tax=Porcisia hertigi TaxID=2761500 RepID=A0A836HIY9_9TRYP|nr:hypothetical protein JKF63_01007 [Porcisia hertigi]